MESWIGLIGTAVGAVIGLIGGALAARAERQLDREKWLRSRADDAVRDTRLAAAEVVSCLAELAHSIMWHTYNYNSKSTVALDKEFLNESHRLISQMVSAQYRLAALNVVSYERVTPLISQSINLVERTEEAINNRDSTEISRCNSSALKLIKSLPDKLGTMLSKEMMGEE